MGTFEDGGSNFSEFYHLPENADFPDSEPGSDRYTGERDGYKDTGIVPPPGEPESRHGAMLATECTPDFDMGLGVEHFRDEVIHPDEAMNVAVLVDTGQRLFDTHAYYVDYREDMGEDVRPATLALVRQSPKGTTYFKYTDAEALRVAYISHDGMVGEGYEYRPDQAGCVRRYIVAGLPEAAGEGTAFRQLTTAEQLADTPWGISVEGDAGMVVTAGELDHIRQRAEAASPPAVHFNDLLTRVVGRFGNIQSYDTPEGASAMQNAPEAATELTDLVAQTISQPAAPFSVYGDSERGVYAEFGPSDGTHYTVGGELYRTPWNTTVSWVAVSQWGKPPTQSDTPKALSERLPPDPTIPAEHAIITLRYIVQQTGFGRLVCNAIWGESGTNLHHRQSIMADSLDVRLLRNLFGNPQDVM